MSVSNKHNHKTFTKSPLRLCYIASKKFSNHSFGKCPDALTMAALIFTKSAGLGRIFIH